HPASARLHSGVSTSMPISTSGGGRSGPPPRTEAPVSGGRSAVIVSVSTRHRRLRCRRRTTRIAAVVGTNDSRHQRMAHDVVLGEVDDPDTFDTRQYFQRI